MESRFHEEQEALQKRLQTLESENEQVIALLCIEYYFSISDVVTFSCWIIINCLAILVLSDIFSAVRARETHYCDCSASTARTSKKIEVIMFVSIRIGIKYWYSEHKSTRPRANL